MKVDIKEWVGYIGIFFIMIGFVVLLSAYPTLFMIVQVNTPIGSVSADVPEVNAIRIILGVVFVFLGAFLLFLRYKILK